MQRRSPNRRFSRGCCIRLAARRGERTAGRRLRIRTRDRSVSRVPAPSRSRRPLLSRRRYPRRLRNRSAPFPTRKSGTGSCASSRNIGIGSTWPSLSFPEKSFPASSSFPRPRRTRSSANSGRSALESEFSIGGTCGLARHGWLVTRFGGRSSEMTPSSS